MKFFDHSGGVPGQPPTGSDGRAVTPLVSSAEAGGNASFFSGSQDGLNKLQNSPAPPVGIGKSSLTMSTPKAQSKIVPMHIDNTPGPDTKRRRAEAETTAEAKPVRIIPYGDTDETNHSSACSVPNLDPAALDSKATPAKLQQGVESDPSQQVAFQTSPIAPIGTEACESSAPLDSNAGDFQGQQAPNERHQPHDHTTSEEDEPSRQQSQPGIQQEREQQQEQDQGEPDAEADTVVAGETDDDYQALVLAKNAAKVMPQVAELHAGSMEKLLVGGRDAGETICDVVRELYTNIMASLAKYKDEVSHKAIAIQDERTNQSIQKAEINQTIQQTSQIAGIMQVCRRTTAVVRTLRPQEVSQECV